MLEKIGTFSDSDEKNGTHGRICKLENIHNGKN